MWCVVGWLRAHLCVPRRNLSFPAIVSLSVGQYKRASPTLLCDLIEYCSYLQYIVFESYMGADARERNIMRRIYDLRRYGLPETLLDIWVQQQGEFLLPVQEAAVQRYGLFDGRSLVISSPTSSGKTFVGEMAAMR